MKGNGCQGYGQEKKKEVNKKPIDVIFETLNAQSYPARRDPLFEGKEGITRQIFGPKMGR